MNMEAMLREVKVEDAIGMVLAHDLTQIIPGKFKGRLFTKGHIVREEDIPSLLSIGKEHIYIMQLQNGFLHEDEAAQRIGAAIRGANVEMTEPREGKVTIRSAIHGLAKINRELIDRLNEIEQIAVSTIRTDTVVHPQHPIAATRVIPLIVEEHRVQRVEELSKGDGSLSGNGSLREDDAIGWVGVKPFIPLRIGLITTGSEVFKGLIQDKFGPAVKAKAAEFGSEIIEQRFTPDDSDAIIGEIRYFQQQGADLILLTGGMSVDPDDRTPGAIKRSGADIVTYGTPMLPGSMLMMAYLGGTPVMGLPGCVMHDPYTSFDVLLARVCAGERIERGDIVAMGYGGLLGC